MLLGQGLHDLGRTTFREISLVSRQVLIAVGWGRYFSVHRRFTRRNRIHKRFAGALAIGWGLVPHGFVEVTRVARGSY